MFEKASFENEEVFLMSDFIINLLNYESNRETADFLNNMHLKSLVPYITLPTCITPRSKTLIDNIFFNEINEAAISGSLISDISDHHAQFFITPKILGNDPHKVTLRRSYKNFSNELFKNNLLKTDWESLLKTNLNDINFSFEQFLLELNNLLDIHAPFKYSKRTDKKRNKLWITNGIANSVRKKNNLHNKLCRAKDSERKEELHRLYKTYKNHVTNLSRRSKESYFKNLFEEIKKNTYKIWQEIKVLININTQTKYAPICLQIKDSIVTDSKVIANEFNNFFNSIATKIDSKIIQTETPFQDALKNPNEKSFFMHPTTKEEIEDNIKLLNDHRTTGPYSIPTQMLEQF